MSHFEDRKNVAAYAKLTERAVDESLYEPLRAHLPAGSAVLEIGSGPGHDLARLGETFDVTGSDKSRAFVDYVQQVRPNATMLCLDACTLEVDRQYDGIFSNKVLQYLSDTELRRSLDRQAEVLRPGGLALHTFPRGEGSMTELEMTVYPRTRAAFAHQLSATWQLVDEGLYSEHALHDSAWVLLSRII